MCLPQFNREVGRRTAAASAGEAAANVDTAIQTLIQELLPVGPGSGCLEGVRALTQLLSPSHP